MEIPDLKPCPFCGSSDVDLYHFERVLAQHVCVKCEHCQTEGPWAAQAASNPKLLAVILLAMERWNTRSGKEESNGP